MQFEKVDPEMFPADRRNRADGLTAAIRNLMPGEVMRITVDGLPPEKVAHSAHAIASQVFGTGHVEIRRTAEYVYLRRKVQP